MVLRFSVNSPELLSVFVHIFTTSVPIDPNWRTLGSSHSKLPVDTRILQFRTFFYRVVWGSLYALPMGIQWSHLPAKLDEDMEKGWQEAGSRTQWVPYIQQSEDWRIGIERRLLQLYCLSSPYWDIATSVVWTHFSIWHGCFHRFQSNDYDVC